MVAGWALIRPTTSDAGLDPAGFPRHPLSGDRWATTLVALELDHVLIAVADLAAAAEEIEARHGLA